MTPIDDAAKLLMVPPARMRQWAKDGHFRTYRRDRAQFVTLDDLRSWLAAIIAEEAPLPQPMGRRKFGMYDIECAMLWYAAELAGIRPGKPPPGPPRLTVVQ